MSSNSNFTYSQSSNGSQASDPGSSSGTGRQLRSSTRGHDTAPASQQTQGDSQATPPNTQDTIHLAQDRATAPSTQSGPSGQNTPDVDINVVLRALTAALEAQRGPGPAATPSTKGIATTGTGAIAELPGNDPMLLSIQEIFPALDTAVVQSIYTNKFQAANLLKLEASFTYKKKRPQFYSFGTGEASLNLSTTCKDVDLEEYESISHLMRPFMVYGVIICTFAPPPQKLPLAFAIMTYVHTLYEHLRTHTWDSVRRFHIVFHQKRISRGVYEPSGWSTPDHGLETAQLFKRMPADNSRPTKRAHTAGAPHGPANRSSSSEEICNNYNKDTCTYPTCRYTHACAICEGPHPATQCCQKQSAPLSQRISRRP